jgi:transposase InsO family protein
LTITLLGSVGSVGDAFDNAMAESFVDTFKTELIKDRVWQTRTQLELAILEYVDWFNNRRLHSRGLAQASRIGPGQVVPRPGRRSA